jgi:hypothetical protein
MVVLVTPTGQTVLLLERVSQLLQALAVVVVQVRTQPLLAVQAVAAAVQVALQVVRLEQLMKDSQVLAVLAAVVLVAVVVQTQQVLLVSVQLLALVAQVTHQILQVRQLLVAVAAVAALMVLAVLVVAVLVVIRVSLAMSIRVAAAAELVPLLRLQVPQVEKVSSFLEHLSQQGNQQPSQVAFAPQPQLIKSLPSATQARSAGQHNGILCRTRRQQHRHSSHFGE